MTKTNSKVNNYKLRTALEKFSKSAINIFEERQCCPSVVIGNPK